MPKKTTTKAKTEETKETAAAIPAGLVIGGKVEAKKAKQEKDNSVDLSGVEIDLETGELFQTLRTQLKPYVCKPSKKSRGCGARIFWVGPFGRAIATDISLDANTGKLVGVRHSCPEEE